MRRELRLGERPVDDVHQKNGVAHGAVVAALEHAAFPVDGNDVERPSARVDGKKFHVTISRSFSPVLRMRTRLQPAGRRGAMRSLHSTRQILPASK